MCRWLSFKKFTEVFLKFPNETYFDPLTLTPLDISLTFTKCYVFLVSKEWRKNAIFNFEIYFYSACVTTWTRICKSGEFTGGYSITLFCRVYLKMVSKTVIYAAVPISAVVVLGLIRKWRSRNWAKCTSNTCLRGKTFLITGANSGIGLETAKALVKRKARVIFACRDIEKAKAAVALIRKEHTSGELVNM